MTVTPIRPALPPRTTGRRPKQSAPALVWALSGTLLKGGAPMTGKQAAEHVRRWSHVASARVIWAAVPATLEVTSLAGKTTEWIGDLPPANDPRAAAHALVSALLLDLPLSSEQGGLFARALDAAIDDPDPDRPVVALLLQLLASGRA